MPSSTPLLGSALLARWRRPVRRSAVALAGLAIAWTMAHAAVDRAPVRARVREKAVALLERRIPSAVLGDEVSIDWLFRASVGPLTIPARTRGAPPVLGIELVKVRLAWLPLLRGRLEPASVRLYRVRVVPGPGGKELLDLLAQLRRPRPGAPATPPAAPRAPDPVVTLRGLTVALPLGGATVDLGPFDLRLERTRDGTAERLDAELGLRGGGHATASLRRTVSDAPSSRPTTGGDTPPATAPRPPAPEGHPAARAGAGGPSTEALARASAGAPAIGPGPPRPAAGPPAWRLTGHVSATAADLPARLRGRAIEASGGALTLELAAEGLASRATATLRGALAGLVLRGAALGREPLGPLDVTGEATLEASLGERRLWLRRAVLRPAGPLVVEAAGAWSAEGDLPFELAVTVPPVDYGALLAALPPALAPGPEVPRPAGAVGGALSVAGPLGAPEAWTVKAEVDLDGLRRAARQGPPSPLLAPFTARPDGEDGPAILLGPASKDFVPIAELPPHVVRAVTTSEDAGFFAHRGFDFDELRNAMVAGLRAGRLQRGGSTITQQLAKNLYLSRDRTLARKAREALVTVALEGTVPKARLLEIYLNLIEWGPALHGIGPAARHYLGKDARELTPREACFLATLIPSPLRSHAALAAGAPAERWSGRIDDLLRKLAAAGVIDEEALALELAAPLALAAWVPSGAAAGEGADGPPAGGEDAETPVGDEAEGEATSAPTSTSTSTPTPTSTSTPAPAFGPRP